MALSGLAYYPKLRGRSVTGLTKKQERFVAAYLGEANFNGTKAARIAGYAVGSCAESASELLTLPKIQEAIDACYRGAALGSPEILVRLTDQARGLGGYLRKTDSEDIVVDWDRLIADGREHIIRKISYTRGGKQVIECYDAQAALALIGKHLDMFTDRLAVTGEMSTEQAGALESLREKLGQIAGRMAPPPVQDDADAIDADFTDRLPVVTPLLAAPDTDEPDALPDTCE